MINSRTIIIDRNLQTFDAKVQTFLNEINVLDLDELCVIPWYGQPHLFSLSSYFRLGVTILYANFSELENTKKIKVKSFRIINKNDDFNKTDKTIENFLSSIGICQVSQFKAVSLVGLEETFVNSEPIIMIFYEA